MLPFPGDDHKFAFFGVEFEKKYVLQGKEKSKSRPNKQLSIFVDNELSRT